MKRRWLIYIVVGVLFGIFDFYYPTIFLHFTFDPHYGGQIIGFAFTFGVWLVPVIPIVLYEAQVSRSKLFPALASSLTWCISIIFYYVTNVFQLAKGSSYQPWMRISNYRAPGFLSNWENELSVDLTNTLEWVVFASIAGFIIGFLVSLIYLFFFRNKRDLQ